MIMMDLVLLTTFISIFTSLTTSLSVYKRQIWNSSKISGVIAKLSCLYSSRYVSCSWYSGFLKVVLQLVGLFNNGQLFVEFSWIQKKHSQKKDNKNDGFIQKIYWMKYPNYLQH